jgi:hypothetical protein
MTFQWLQMRITEEQERRRREKQILDMLPGALAELAGVLRDCVAAYTSAFGPDAVTLQLQPRAIRVAVQEPAATVDVLAVPEIPGFEVRRRDGDPLIIEVGLLPSNKLSYRDRGADQYLNVEEVTRRILDRALFPKLRE